MEPFIGQITTVGFTFAPQGWAFCNGDSVSIAQYTALFALLGTTYGGNGQTTFNLPDLRGRTVVGQGNGPGLTPMVAGQVGGADSITLLTSNLPAHNHLTAIGVSTSDGEEATPTGVIANKAFSFNEGPSANSFLGGTSVTPAGQSQPLQFRNPYQGINHIIAMEGIFPSRN